MAVTNRKNILLFVLCCKFFVLCFSGYHQHSVLYIPIINIPYCRNIQSNCLALFFTSKEEFLQVAGIGYCHD